ncbi:PAAR-like protein [Clostridium sp. Marseille-P2415]|uniref:PAAR-like protein n=1 Tax=Clostridium sp. Marseille-P2415 TaxID=1805471 RepID=UPI000988432B|nr:PAAR-like protein [Clostridium sp. Marseille-P2415]
MAEITNKDAAKLVSLIYGTTMNENYEELKSNKLSDLVDLMESNVSSLDVEEKIGGEMTKEEFLDVIDQIKDSDTLMRMEIKDFSNNEKTDFRAMTLVDPENEVNPTIVFRGTAGDSQWDDNLAAIFSSQTPSQKEAAAYVIKSGLDHITLAGHSKGGNMAASCAYLLPEGLIDKVYSYDGQGESQTFLSEISAGKQKYAKSIIYNINEYRDPVSQLLAKTGLDKNSIYFDSGVDYINADLQDKNFNFKMYFFHVHKPNYYLKSEVKVVNRTFVPSRIANKISMMNEIDALPEGVKRTIAQKISGLLYAKDGSNSTKWNDHYWDCVLEAEEVYSRVNKSREDAICRKLSEMYHVDFSKFKLDQEDTSFVVEGAILMCPYCGGLGDLKNIENHGNMIQHKAVASKKDNKPGENIAMQDCECSADAPGLIMDDSESGGVEPCMPEIYHEWVITEPDKVLYIDGEKVEAVLKKSVLGCCRGGIITVEDNGQMDLSAVKKLSLAERVKKAVENNKIIQSKPAKYWINSQKGLFDKTFMDNKLKKMADQINLNIDLAETAINGVTYSLGKAKESADKFIDKTMDSIKQETDSIINRLEDEKDKWIEDVINYQLQFK